MCLVRVQVSTKSSWLHSHCLYSAMCQLYCILYKAVHVSAVKPDIEQAKENQHQSNVGIFCMVDRQILFPKKGAMLNEKVTFQQEKSA